MNIFVALGWSKKTGKPITRGGGWVKYDPAGKYKLSAEDLLATDWEPIDGIRQINPRTLVFTPGQQIGRWTVIGRAERAYGDKHAYWKVRCVCGFKQEVQASRLGTHSSGCRKCHLKTLHFRAAKPAAPR